MNSNFGSSSDSNWGSSSNSKLEAKWVQMRREDEECDEEIQVRRNKQNMAVVMAVAMVCQPTEEQPQWGGSIAGHSYKPLNKAMSHVNLMNNYFNPNSVYTEEDFRRRFRMRCHVFECLLRDVQQVNPYFRQKLDRASCPSFSPHQKVTVALRMMAYGSPADSMDETHGMSKSTCLDTIQQLCDTIDEYLSEPNQEDLNRLLCKAEDRGFPGIIGSLDCMHWDWKNCPTRWQKGFSGRSRKPTVVLKAVASYDTWIWHAFFRVPESQNDITVLGRSPLFNNLTEGKAPQLHYYINNRQYNMGYYLADGIYPKWATLVQAIPNPKNDAEKLFTLNQEAYRKDVERAFVLQARWKIISESARGWSRENLDSIMMSCIILHNMIVKDEQDEYIDGESDDDQEDPNRSRRARAKIYDGPNLPFNPRTGNISINGYMRL